MAKGARAEREAETALRERALRLRRRASASPTGNAHGARANVAAEDACADEFAENFLNLFLLEGVRGSHLPPTIYDFSSR